MPPQLVDARKADAADFADVGLLSLGGIVVAVVVCWFAFDVRTGNATTSGPGHYS